MFTFSKMKDIGFSVNGNQPPAWLPPGPDPPNWFFLQFCGLAARAAYVRALLINFAGLGTITRGFYGLRNIIQGCPRSWPQNLSLIIRSVKNLPWAIAIKWSSLNLVHFTICRPPHHVLFIYFFFIFLLCFPFITT